MMIGGAAETRLRSEWATSVQAQLERLKSELALMDRHASWPPHESDNHPEWLVHVVKLPTGDWSEPRRALLTAIAHLTYILQEYNNA